MANSYREFTFSGSSANVDVTFGYLSRTHVYVEVAGVLVDPSTYMWLSDAQIQLGSVPTAGTIGKVGRITPTDPITDFQPGNIDSSDLNNAQLQALYVAAEAEDVANSVSANSWQAPQGQTAGTLAANGAENTVPRYDASGNLLGDGPSIAEIGASEANAEIATAQAAIASTQATNATNSATLASQWAQNPVNVPVVTGQFSALHWATQALSAYSSVIAGIAAVIHGATAKAPVDNDEFGITDSAASFVIKKVTLLSLLATIFSTAKFYLADSTDATKKAVFNLAAITTGTTRNVRVPDMDTSTGVWEPIGDYTLTASSALSITGLSAFRKIRVSGQITVSALASVVTRLSSNNGTSYDSGASDYTYQALFGNGSSAGANSAAANSMLISTVGGIDASSGFAFEGTLEAFNKAEPTRSRFLGSGVVSAAALVCALGNVRVSAVAHNALQILLSSGTMTGRITVEGVRG